MAQKNLKIKLKNILQNYDIMLPKSNVMSVWLYFIVKFEKIKLLFLNEKNDI